MKFLCLPDMHIDGDRPVNRIDNYWETVKKKLVFAFDVANNYRADAVLSPGDFTNTPSLSWIEFSDIVNMFNKCLADIEFYCCFGQHDMRYRTKANTALMGFYYAVSKFYILEQSITKNKVIMDDTVTIYGCSYNDEIPEIVNDKRFNILLIHRMIIDKKLWSKQTDYEPSNLFIRDNPFDLIISGDNHQQFEAKTPGGRWLFNCGTMMRNKIDMIDYKPYMIIFDTNTKQHERIYFPIEPASKVFRMEKVAEEKERDEKLEAFVSGLSSQKELSLSFEDNLIKYIAENHVDEGVARIALDSLR